MITVRIHDLKDAPITVDNPIPEKVYRFEIRHTRNYTGNKVDQTGGHTLLFCLDNGKIYGSRCNRTDKFHKRLGVIVCLQHFLGKCEIIDFVFKKDEIVMFVNSNGKPDNWYLRENLRVHCANE